jgi:hypothetical protein
VVRKLELAWNHTENLEDGENIKKFCDLVLHRANELAIPTARRVAVRNRTSASSLNKALFATNQGCIRSGLVSARIGDEDRIPYCCGQLDMDDIVWWARHTFMALCMERH